MDWRAQHKLEGSFNLPEKISGVWYPENHIRYTGGFYRIQFKSGYKSIWGDIFLKKEVARPKTIKTYGWRWAFGFIPVLTVISTKEGLGWKKVWAINTGGGFDSIGAILSFIGNDWEGYSTFDAIKVIAARHGMVLGKDMIKGVFQEPVAIMRKLYFEMLGHD